MKNKTKNQRNKREFSKVLLIQESILIWLLTLAFVCLATLCIAKNYTGSLPWLTAMTSFPWTAYGVSQCFYYNKSKAENTKNGIKYETVVNHLIEKDANQDDKNDTSTNLDYGI